MKTIALPASLATLALVALTGAAATGCAERRGYGEVSYMVNELSPAGERDTVLMTSSYGFSPTDVTHNLSESLRLRVEFADDRWLITLLDAGVMQAAIVCEHQEDVWTTASEVIRVQVARDKTVEVFANGSDARCGAVPVLNARATLGIPRGPRLDLAAADNAAVTR